MASLSGVEQYIYKTYKQQQATRHDLEVSIRQLWVSPRPDLGPAYLPVFIEELVKKLMHISEDLGSMRRLLGDLRQIERQGSQ